jgi:hypothetical protein
LSRNALERLKAEFVLIDDMVAQIAKMTDDFTNVNNIKTIIVGDALDEDFQAQKTLYESYVSETQVDGTDYTLFAELATADIEKAKDALRSWLYHAKNYYVGYWEGLRIRGKPKTRHFNILDQNDCLMGVTCELSMDRKCIKGACTLVDWKRCGGVAFNPEAASPAEKKEKQDEFFFKICKGIDTDVVNYQRKVTQLEAKFNIGQVASVTQTSVIDGENVEYDVPLSIRFGEGANLRQFEFPSVVHYDHYKHIVFRVTDVASGKSRLRWAYKSQSGGGWRVSPGVINKKHFMKGWDYTHLTKPSLRIEEIFSAIPEQSHAWMNSGGVMNMIYAVFDSEAHVTYFETEDHNIQAYAAQEVSEIQDSSFFAENQGDTNLRMNWDLMTKLNQHGVEIPQATKTAFLRLIDQGFRLSDDSDYWSEEKCELSRDLLNSPALSDFVPDSNSTPEKVEAAYHSLLGNYNLYHYNAELGNLPIRWTIGSALHNGQMKTWVHKIFFRDEENTVNSYGLYPTNIGPAFFNNKPFDYVDQSEGRGVVFDTKYNDMTSVLPTGIPFLNNFVRNFTNVFREEALRQINLFETALKESTTADGKRRIFRASGTRRMMGYHSWQHFVVEKVVAHPGLTKGLQMHKEWCKYLFQQIVGLDREDEKTTYKTLKAAVKKAYTISGEEAADLEYML